MSRDTRDLPGAEHAAARRAQLLKALRLLAARWPKYFAPDRAEALVPVWQEATGGIDPDVFERAALELAASHQGKYAPEPYQFAQVARRLEARYLTVTTGAPDADPLPQPWPEKQLDRIDQMGRWAYARVGSWALVAAVWALLWETAPDDESRTAVRNGTLDREVFRDAVDAVKRGMRPSSARHLTVPIAHPAA